MRELLPKTWRRKLVRWSRRPRIGSVNWGDLRRLKPFSRVWGGDRGLPIDRYYIEKFLAANASSICGTVLEIGDDGYSRRFGGESVGTCEILSSDGDGEGVTWQSDLADAIEIPEDRFDCIVLTQTLQFVPDATAAIETLYRILAPGGILLLTVPGISHSTKADSRRWADYWRFTPNSVRWLLAKQFSDERLEVDFAGNVMACTAFLYGLATDELEVAELDYRDLHYPLIVTARAQKHVESIP